MIGDQTTASVVEASEAAVVSGPQSPGGSAVGCERAIATGRMTRWPAPRGPIRPGDLIHIDTKRVRRTD